MYENCGQCFPYVAKCQEQGVKPKQDAPEYQSKWSDSHAGQCKWGGWDLAGRMRYIELQKKISKAKRKEHVGGVEARALKSLRAKNNIGTKPAPKDKGRTLKDFEGKAECLASFGVESGDESETENGEEDDSDFEAFEETYRPVPQKKN